MINYNENYRKNTIRTRLFREISIKYTIMKHEIETKYNIGDPHFTAINNKLVECFIGEIFVESIINVMEIRWSISYKVLREFSKEELDILRTEGFNQQEKPIIGMFKEKDIIPEPLILYRSKITHNT